MSHFTVLVLGPDPDEQLYPFSENLQVPPYRSYFNGDAVWEQCKHNTNPIVPTFNQPSFGTQADDLSKYYQDLVFEDPDLAKNDPFRWYTLSTYNQNAKWDWYVIGGRWQGMFLLKENRPGILGDPGVFGSARTNLVSRADQAFKKDIDFVSMKAEAAFAAHQMYDTYEQVTKDLVEPGPVKTFFAAHNLSEDDPQYQNIVRQLRAEWNSLPYNKALRKADIMPFFEDPYYCYHLDQPNPRQSFVNQATSSYCSTYAILDHGTWQEPAKMGWFGTPLDDVDPKAWDILCTEKIQSAPDDTLLTVVDCHI